MIAPMYKRILVIVLLLGWVAVSGFALLDDYTDFPIKKVYSNPTINLDSIARRTHHPAPHQTISALLAEPRIPNLKKSPRSLSVALRRFDSVTFCLFPQLRRGINATASAS